jgi:Xaa-Pro aminopeptidase
MFIDLFLNIIKPLAMKNLHILTIVLIFSLGLANNLNSQSADEFRNRRKEVINKMEPRSVLLLRTPQMAGMFDYARYGGNFYYLTGIDEPNCTLILFSNDFQIPSSLLTISREILFISPVNSGRVNWDAQTIGIEGAKSIYGIEDARSASEASEFIGRLLAYNLTIVYMDVEKSFSINVPLSGDEQLMKMARDHGATFTILSPSTILNPMLSKKSAAEIELMRKVISITAEAQREALRSLKPGLFEYQLDAIIRYIFSVNGSGSVAFPTIIGSGINSVVLHWMENSHKMEEGDIVVVDCGAEKDMYTADITRTYPVSGKYSDRQKAIYEIVLKANEEAIKMVAPGIKMVDVSHKADSVLADGMVRVGLIKDKADFKKYYYHGLSHQIGLKNAYGGLVQILEPGMIITIEPGVYVREEKTGVRIEDDVLVTADGCEVLSKNAPKQIPEIEKLMKEEGMNVFGKR